LAARYFEQYQPK